MSELLFELDDPGSASDYLPPLDVPEAPMPFAARQNLDLPELDEHSVVRHFTRLSHRTFSIDTHFYPLGSCTMKYNPKLNEAITGYRDSRAPIPCRTNKRRRAGSKSCFAPRMSSRRSPDSMPARFSLWRARRAVAGLLMIRAS